MAGGNKPKTKSKGGSGSANDKRGGIAKAKEAAQRSGNDRAGGDEGARAESRSGSTSGGGRGKG